MKEWSDQFCATFDWAMITMGLSDWWGEGVVCLVGKGGGTSLRDWEDLGVDISARLHRI